MDFSQVKRLNIPEGDVIKIKIDDTDVWEAEKKHYQISLWQGYIDGGNYVKFDGTTYTGIRDIYDDDQYVAVMPLKDLIVSSGTGDIRTSYEIRIERWNSETQSYDTQRTFRDTGYCKVNLKDYIDYTQVHRILIHIDGTTVVRLS